MNKIKLKIGDKIETWNGSKGEVSELNFPNISLTNSSSFTQEFHIMNIKFVNGKLIDDIVTGIEF